MSGTTDTDRVAVVQQTCAHVQQALADDRSGHDWWHVYRVWKTAASIGTQEGADLYVVELAALLHDIADWKFHGGDESAGESAAREWLNGMQVDPAVVHHVCQIISQLSFKGAGTPSPMPTREGMVVQDADRLDALGALGIARAFAYGGHAGKQMHHPEIPPEYHASFEEYKRSRSTTINHFYEKLLLLKDLMNTATARALAEERHAFMETFLRRFFREWEGKA